MIVDQLFKKKLDESLADQIMQSARAAGLNPRLAGTPEQERERTRQMMAQRQQERDAASRSAAEEDARNLMALKTEYKQMKDRYESLGGSDWQYADREQNLSNSEREARSMEPALRTLSARIAAAEKVITKDSELDEGMARAVDAEGRTQQQWIEAVYKQFPDARIVQAKMIDGPCHAMLPDGRKFSWTPVQGMAEGSDTAEDYRAKAQWLRSELHLSPDEAWERAYDTDPETWVGSPWEDDYKQGMAEAKANTAAFRASNKKRAEINAMTPEERKEYDKEQAEKQRKRDDARLEKERQKLAAKKSVSESRRLNEAMLMEDPVYRKFKTVGRYIAERKMSEKEILQVFADAEAGMTDKATGANRTFLGRGKDTTMDFAGGVADALKGVWSGIQSSVPVAAVDVAYDQATDALGKLAGGQKGAVMQAIKKYRMLAKQYPKTAGLAKAALVAITGLATGGAGVPAVAALVYGLDSAIKGEKFSDIALKAGGAAATAWAASKIAGMVGGDQAAANTDQALNLDAEQMARNAADAKAYGIDGADTLDQMNAAIMQTAEPGTIPADYSQIGAGPGVGGGTEYIVQPDDVLSTIAAKNNVSVGELMQANPDITNPDFIRAGQTINIPAETGSSVYQGGVGTNADTMAKIASGEYADSAISQNLARAGQGPELLGGPAAGDVAGVPVNAQPTLSFTNGNTGTLSLPDGSQVPVQAFPSGGIQPRLPMGGEVVPVNYAGQDVKAYIYNGRAYIKNFSPEQFSNPVQESWLPAVKMRKLPFDKLVDEKSTVMNWALNESVGRKSNSVHLTAIGTYTVFENVDRYRRAIMELKGVPGSTRPEYYRPDMSGAPAPTKPPKNQSWFGKGLDYLDKGVKKVGSALSNFGHQFTTNVTKEKLKMNWHQAGKPSDSDQLSAWLVKQGVPIGVVNSVYSKMGLPVSAEPTTPTTPAEPTTTEPKAKTGGAQRLMPFNNINPATGQRWTVDDLDAELNRPEKEKIDAAAGKIPAYTPPEAVTPTAPNLGTPPITPITPVGYNATNVMQLPGMQSAKKPAPAKTPNFAGPGGYGKTTTTVKPMTGIPGMKPAAPAPATTAAPSGTKVTTGGPTPDEQAKLAQRIAQATAKPVAEMLSMVETKEDVQKIKQFVDQTFVKYGAVSESAFAVRNQILEHVTQVGAQRRREYSQRMAI